MSRFAKRFIAAALLTLAAVATAPLAAQEPAKRLATSTSSSASMCRAAWTA